MRIGARQLFTLMFLFEIGSAAVVNLGMDAKQDAWLAILTGMLAGLAMYLVYTYLFQSHGSPLTQFVRKLLGTYLGWFIGMLYVLYFFYISARVLRDFCELLVTAALGRTPILAVAFLMMLVVTFAAFEGIETIARASELVMWAILLLGILAVLAVITSDVVHPENLQPVLENGWKPVLKTAFPLTFTFPFGETVVFLMLLPYLHDRSEAKWTGLAAILVSGIVLCLIIILNISVSGVPVASTEQFPLLLTVGKLQLGDVLQRMDIIAVSLLIIGGFFKVLIFFYAGLAGTKDLFRIGQRKWMLVLMLVMAAIIVTYSIKMAGSFAKHIEVGLAIVPYYMHLPLQAGIPLLLLLLTWFRQRRSRTS